MNWKRYRSVEKNPVVKLAYRHTKNRWHGELNRPDTIEPKGATPSVGCVCISLLFSKPHPSWEFFSFARVSRASLTRPKSVGGGRGACREVVLLLIADRQAKRRHISSTTDARVKRGNTVSSKEEPEHQNS